MGEAPRAVRGQLRQLFIVVDIEGKLGWSRSTVELRTNPAPPHRFSNHKIGLVQLAAHLDRLNWLNLR